MQPNVQQGARRVHAADFKAKVLAQCREPGASVAAVAMAHGVNANLVRKWLVGRGLKRAGLVVPSGVPCAALSRAGETAAAALPAPPLPVMRFVPVGLAAAGSGDEPSVEAGMPGAAEPDAPAIRVELRCGDADVAVRWPASHAPGCAAWLSELASALFKG
ncbi:transposase [Roseateles sp.]|uniref:transposase n=1 Tax=Roseateles sp. TaxID=1971397 RepID=UPI00326505B9